MRQGYNITSSLDLFVPNRHSLQWATKWFHIHSGDAVSTSILLWQTSRQQTLTIKMQHRAIALVQPSTSFNKRVLLLPCPFHQQSPWQTISTASSTPGWSPIVPLKSSIRTSDVSDFGWSIGSYLSRILLSQLPSADSVLPPTVDSTILISAELPLFNSSSILPVSSSSPSSSTDSSQHGSATLIYPKMFP